MFQWQGQFAMEKYQVDFKTMPWETPAVGVRFKAYEQNGRKLRLAEFTKEFVESDWCTKGHVGYVLEGRMEIDFDGKVIMFGPGDGLFIPAGEERKHKAKVLTDTLKIILVEDV
jgi:ethanolamine utilization protein EutQ (cupin superfamily)